MKIFIQTVMASIVAGYASYYITLGFFKTLLWLFDYELTASQRIFVVENGYLAFVAGMLVGMVMFQRFFRLHNI